VARRLCEERGHPIEARESPIWWIKYYQGGRTIRETTRTTQETKARRILRAREGDIERGIPINPKMGRITFEEAANDLLNDYAVNGKRTLAHARRRIALHLAPFFRGQRLVSISASDVRAFVAKRKADTILVSRSGT
jgi:hypothetical protein